MEGEGDSGQRGADEKLHEQYPPALGAQNINDRTPEWFYHPRQIEP